MPRILRGFTVFLAAALLLSAVRAPAFAQVTFGLSVNIGPPALPYYQQPPNPAPNYIWNPGFWAWGPGGYYWVPGTWVAAPNPGLLWTPGYWSAYGGGYGWNAGYWAPQVGFYGGINYGYGYNGSGYYGGRWNGNQFAYNSAVSNVNPTYVRNVYVDRSVVNNYYNNPSFPQVSYNGGRGGIQARPSASQQAVSRERHVSMTATQTQHVQTAAGDRNLYASVNKGRPQQAAVAQPFSSSRKPANYAPVSSQDRQAAQSHVVAHQTTGVQAPQQHVSQPQQHVQQPQQHAQQPQQHAQPPQQHAQQPQQHAQQPQQGKPPG